MNKKNGVKQLGKPTDQRKALIKSQLRDLISHGFLKTTKARGKAIVRQFGILMAYTIDGNMKIVEEYFDNNKIVAQSLLKINSEERKSGFAKVTPFKKRSGDKAELVLIEVIK